MVLRAGVIGDPISHSLSPRLHGYWLKEFGIAGEYGAIEVKSSELGGFISSMAGEYVGVNITLPHKEAAISHCDEVSAVAKIIGAVNTLWFEGGKLMGDNTDVAGFIGGLGDLGDLGGLGAVPNKVALILGAGGAARAVIYGLLSSGFSEVRIVNRTIDRAFILADEFSSYGVVRVLPYDEMDDNLRDCCLVVNCSSAGVLGSAVRFPNFSLFPSGAIAYDISYVPYETEFLREASRFNLGLRYGIDMLIHQAIPGFCRWFCPKSVPLVDERLRSYLVSLL